MYKPSQSGLQYPIFNGGSICPLKKHKNFDLHTPLDFEAKDSTLNLLVQWMPIIIRGQSLLEEAEEEEDEVEGSEEEGNRAKRRKA